MAQRPDHRRLVEAEHADRVVCRARQAGALRQQVGDAELARDPRVLKLEVRIEVDYPVVPGELALVDGDGERGGEEGLRGRADLEHAVRAHRLVGALAAGAEALASTSRSPATMPTATPGTSNISMPRAM
jgi:hypothetical protein